MELRLRSSLLAHKATGYEIAFDVPKQRRRTHKSVRWNGPLGDFTYLKGGEGSRYGVKNGDVVKATIVGERNRCLCQRRQMLQVSDDTYKNGSPGMGLYIHEATRGNDDYGFTAFEASD